MSTIMVQVADCQKTLEALHFACALARSKQSRVAVVKMVPVPHVGWLGTELGYSNLSDQDCQELTDYQAIAESYGVEVEAHAFQYTTMTAAIAEAADYVDAQIVFAALPTSIIPFWYRFRAWVLRQRLAQGNRQVYLLERGSDPAGWTPAILVPAASAPHTHS